MWVWPEVRGRIRRVNEGSVFYGREEELSLMRGLAKDLSRGWGWTLFLGAPPAAGKTALRISLVNVALLILM